MSLDGNTAVSPELWTLASRACNCDLAAEDQARLDALLAADPAAREFYGIYMMMHAELVWRFRGRDADTSGPRVESRELRVESEGEWPDSPIPNPEIPVINLQIPTLNSRFSTLNSWTLSYSVATVLLAIFLLGAWSYTITHPDADSLTAKNSRRATPSRAAEKAPAEFTFVGHVSGLVDCQWSDPTTETFPGAGVALNRRYALHSGLMEITYDSGAKVILQGPCEYTVESPRSSFLKVGKLVAKVESRESRDESAKPQAANPESPNPRTPNPQSPTPHSPRPSPLFSVRTPTATVEDLGTEFGVEVLQSGETTSHVLQGRVVMRTAGTWDGGRGAGDKNPNPESPNPRIPNPEIVLSAGQSARVEKDAKSGELKLLSGDKVASSAQTKYVRRLREPPKFLDLLDIVAGGNGLGNRRESGIDPIFGDKEATYLPGQRWQDNVYCRVGWSKLIDGVFLPDGRAGPIQVDSAGHMFHDFPATNGRTYGSIWARAAELPHTEAANNPLNWPYALGGGKQFMPENRGLLCLCANTGLTFNLNAVRRMYSESQPARFLAVVGLADSSHHSPHKNPLADAWVLTDGTEKWRRLQLRPRDGAVKVQIELDQRDNFLTLAVTDGGNGIDCDWVVWGDPVLEMREDRAISMTLQKK
jgi:hypothetical protein